MPRRRNGRRKPRTPVNIVYRTIQASNGPTATARVLGVSLATLARWRQVGRVSDAAVVLNWAGHLHQRDGAAYRLACQLAGVSRRKSRR